MNVFISYSSKDRPAVENLAQDIESLGHTVWFDQEPSRTGGQTWWDGLFSQIRHCDLFVFALSQNALESELCKHEYRYAYALNKRILPVLVVAPNLPHELRELKLVPYQHSGALAYSLSQLPSVRPLPDPLPSQPALPTSKPTQPIPRSRQIVGGVILILSAVLTTLCLFGLGSNQAMLTILDPQPSITPSSTFTSPQLTAIAAVPTVTSNTAWKPQTQIFNGVEMVLVPPGCFKMGSSESSREMPVHDVCITKPFWLDKTEVTNLQYGSEGYYRGEDRPREMASWDEAQQFCVKRGGRLPTESEWEYAARGPQSWVYPWGDWLDVYRVIFNRTQEQGTANVGSNVDGASWVGALDLLGNVSEWTSDWYEAQYETGYSKYDPQGLVRGTSKVRRGGSWEDSIAVFLRSSARDWGVPSYHYSVVGFRCIRQF